MSPNVVHEMNTVDVKEEPKLGPVRTDQLGRLHDRPKVAKVAEK